MRPVSNINLYGTKSCLKTQYYKRVLNEIGLPYQFLDVEASEDHAEELRNLYESRKLNFPTITIGNKKLRNPYKEDLIKWINKLIP
jgi:glutaredoxin